MTHSLHRSGDPETQKRDFCWFLYQTKGVNDDNFKEKSVPIIEAAEKQGTENWGDVKTGPILKNAAAAIKENITPKSRIRGVFTRREQVVGWLKEVKELNTGLSTIVTGVLDEVLLAGREAGLKPHSVNYSLGVWGRTELLPDATTLSITTMCGHHMIPPKFVNYIMKRVKSGKMTPEEGANRLCEFCYCGIFNQVRCAEILGRPGGE